MQNRHQWEVADYSKTTFVTVNQYNNANISYLGANSKTTFVTVNRG